MDRHYGMDLLDGSEVVQTLKLQKCTVPIIGMTAFASDDELNDFKSKGLNDVCTKPLTPDVFVKTIQSIIYIYLEYVGENKSNSTSPSSPVKTKKSHCIIL